MKAMEERIWLIIAVYIIVITLFYAFKYYIKEYTQIPEILTGKMDVSWYLKRQNYIGFNKAIKKNEVLRFGCNNITEKDIDYVCMHAISEKNGAASVIQLSLKLSSSYFIIRQP